jgi:hypothetical protein
LWEVWLRHVRWVAARTCLGARRVWPARAPFYGYGELSFSTTRWQVPYRSGSRIVRGTSQR